MTLPVPENQSPSAVGQKEQIPVITPAGILAEPDIPPEVTPYVSVVSPMTTIPLGTGEIIPEGDAIPVPGTRAHDVAQSVGKGKPKPTKSESYYLRIKKRVERNEKLESAA